MVKMESQRIAAWFACPRTKMGKCTNWKRRRAEETAWFWWKFWK